MISGMSREKPALDLFLYIDSAWSLYERIGDKIKKRGAQKPATDASHCMVKIADGASRKGKGVALRQNSKTDGAVLHARGRRGQIQRQQ